METQDTAENLQARLLAAERRLLTEGIPSYFDALMAIQELQQISKSDVNEYCAEGVRNSPQRLACAWTLLRSSLTPNPKRSVNQLRMAGHFSV